MQMLSFTTCTLILFPFLLAPTITAIKQHVILHRDLREQRPVVHTFFARMTGTFQQTGMTDTGHQDLLDAWQKAWSDAGWEPRVLAMEDAQRYPDYERYNDVLEGFDPPINEYNKLCFRRWFAMSAAGGGWMCDYDVFPLNMNAADNIVLPNDGNFTDHDYFVPSLSSGSAAEWDRMSHVMVNTMQEHNTTRNLRNIPTDMFVLKYLAETTPETFLKSREVRNGHIPFYTSPRKVDCVGSAGKKAIHFSHHAMVTTARSGGFTGIAPADAHRAVEMRGQVAPTFLADWSAQCSE